MSAWEARVNTYIEEYIAEDMQYARSAEDQAAMVAAPEFAPTGPNATLPEHPADSDALPPVDTPSVYTLDPSL